MNSKSVTRIAVISKAIKVINFVSEHPEGCNIKEIAYSLKINISSCYHIVNTLLDEEYLERNEDSSIYVGKKLMSLQDPTLY